MTSVSQWFGPHFTELHPLLQTLHTDGGALSGDVEIKFGKGVAGFMGKRLVKKLHIPTDGGTHSLQVVIKHTDNELHWSRCFDNSNSLNSIFIPVGDKSNGYWVEKTGGIELYLTVSVQEGGWYWKPLKVKIMGLRLPLWLLPKTEAYKYIESGQYRFYVGFSVLFLGNILSYSGLLSLDIEGK